MVVVVLELCLDFFKLVFRFWNYDWYMFRFSVCSFVRSLACGNFLLVSHFISDSTNLSVVQCEWVWYLRSFNLCVSTANLACNRLSRKKKSLNVCKWFVTRWFIDWTMDINGHLRVDKLFHTHKTTKNYGAGVITFNYNHFSIGDDVILCTDFSLFYYCLIYSSTPRHGLSRGDLMHWVIFTMWMFK